ncbi:MAG TPA: tRNA lysidine(34) synthetase TilS, partial [Candidatus Saccharibacteria bacterium]|nr:tRNA lysidine(34) synthetase TilS [Candidatus Saccharibacteria bacterium]
LSRKNIMQAERYIINSNQPNNYHVKGNLHIEIGYGTLKVTCQPETFNHFKNFSTHILTPEYPFSNDMFRLYVGDSKKDNVANINLPEQKLIVRHRQVGDRVYPQGMTGSKKLQDIFVDKKISRAHRDHWPLVVNDKNEILWVPFVVTDRRSEAEDSEMKIISIICEVNK